MGASRTLALGMARDSSSSEWLRDTFGPLGSSLIEALGRAEAREAVIQLLSQPAFRQVALDQLRKQVGLEARRRADQLALLAVGLQSPAWPRQGSAAVAAARREIGAVLRMASAQGWLDDPRAYHRDPEGTTLVRIESARLPWLRYESLRFTSEWTPHARHPGAPRWRSYAGNRTVHAAMLRHAEMDRPWLVCIHGYGMGVPAVDLALFDAERIYREHGLNVLCVVLPLHGARAAGSPGASELMTTGVSSMLHCHSQAVWDVRRILGWLRDCGAERIGLHGVSLGGNVAALLAALEPDLESVIAGVPATDFTHSVRRGAADEPGDPVPWVDDPVWDDLRTALRVISPVALEPVVARQRLAIYAGQVDAVVPTASVRALWKHWDRPEVAWYPGGHLGFFFEPQPRKLVERRLAGLAR